MLQVVLKKAFDLETVQTEIPEPKSHEVLIKMSNLGICGSDVQVYSGKHKYNIFPLVQGHEGSGIVEKTGDKVKNFKAGDKVTIQPQIFCGKCQPCLEGHINVCENLKVIGIHANGLAAEYAAVDESMLLALPDSVDCETGAMTEPLSVAVGTLRRCGDLTGLNIVVMGAGTIGNLVAQTALVSGAGKVLLTDINDKRLELAERCGIRLHANTSVKPLSEAIRECFGARGADIIIDCAAVPAALTEAIAAARPASRIVIVGNYKVPVEIELPMLQRRQIDMLGIMMYIREDFEKAIELMTENKVALKPLISDHFRPEDFAEAYECIFNNPERVMKVMIDFNREGGSR